MRNGIVDVIEIEGRDLELIEPQQPGAGEIDEAPSAACPRASAIP